MTRKILLPLLFALILPFIADARSVYSPRHSGLEAPGNPKRLENMPGPRLSRTPNGSPGYTDAYGNPVENIPPEEKKNSNRPKPEWMQKNKNSVSRLPDPSLSSSPLWKF